MKSILRACFGVLLFAFTLSAVRAVEPVWNYAVQVSAVAQTTPLRLTLSWPQDTSVTPSSYTVYRKAPGATSWGTGTALAGTATSYVDNTITSGTAYEYQIVKNAGSYSGYGYIQAGVNVALTESRGKVVLIVDNTYATNLAAELSRLQQDLVGDGWTVLRHDVNRTDSPVAVKNLIKADYNADPANVKSVFLFGHVPVPYSGQLNPDGHPDHVGAWPADVFYGDMDGSWTDNSVNFTQTVNTDPADAARLTNRIGDGKFDQTTIPSAVELQVGRVDLANLPGQTSWGSPPTFPNEQELLRQYLSKDHNFRQGITQVQRRGIVGDYFGVRNGEAFAASGYRSFAPLFGAGNITNLNTQYNDAKGVWVPTLAANNYLWAYGAGAGSYLTIGGLGNFGSYNDTNTVELVSNDIHATFVMLFGSWLGDWDHEDNIMRGVLATRTNGLAAMWSGRPHWFVHPMGLGETIGYATRLTQNNTGLYKNQINSSQNLIHIALQGDPTLRLHMIAPPATLGGTVVGSTATLVWLPSPDTGLAGYHVYRATSAAGPFTRLTGALTTATTFVDTSAPANATYEVRAVRLENTPSGSYYNASQAAFWSVGGGSIPTVDTTAPTIALTAPSGGSTLTGTANVSANASDNVGVVGVQFKLDGANLGAEDTTSPYSIAWDTTSTAIGQHTLSAVARDLAGNQAATTVVTVTVSNTSGSNTVWIEDALPAGAVGSATGGDAWTWVNSSPAPFSGTKGHQTNLATGLHEHSFNWASSSLAVGTGDKLYTYIYLDPANPPTEVMISWNGNNWEHRAYWGANTITYGTNGTASRYYVGPLPTAGQWARLEVPASALGLEGQNLTGMSFSLYGGRATWDYTGKSSGSSTPPPPPPPPSDTTAPSVTLTAPATGSTVSGSNVAVSANASDNLGVIGVQFKMDGANLGAEDTTAPYSVTWNTSSSANGAHTLTAVARDAAGNLATSASVSANVNNVAQGTSTSWFDDALPAGASGSGTGGDTWTWTTSGPAPFSGTKAHQTNLASGVHEHSFNWASSTLAVATGDKLYAYIYLDPANPPTEVMLSWNGNNWEHRAYWGANTMTYGTNGTASRYYVGPLPAAGQWARLEVPASAVGLEGQTLTGMSFSLYGGRATWDVTGKSTAVAAPQALPDISITATDGSATIGSSDNAVLTFSRTGSTASALTVNYTLGGTAVKWNDYRTAAGDMPVAVTIPAGATAATMTIVAVANGTNANPETASFTVASDPAYTVGSPAAATITLLSGTVTPSGGGGSGSLGTFDTTSIPAISLVDSTNLMMANPGNNGLHILTPTVLELVRINAKAPDPATVDSWNFVDGAGTLTAPSASKFTVKVDGQTVAVQSVGFRRRPLYAPLVTRDLRITNSLFLTLATPVAEGQTVVVTNADGSLWPATMTYSLVAHPLRYSPAVHVNQEGYEPASPKSATVGYYLGNLGELQLPATTFKLVNAATGVAVFQGSLVLRPDIGYTYSPTPYQKVCTADFGTYTTPGEYYVVVPGLGASLPFMISDGITMDFARTYALGLYAQRCGTDNVMPFTRFVHEVCHVDPASVPTTASTFNFTWATIARYANTINTNNPAQIAPALTSAAAQLYPFVNQGTIDVSGGHHDAGDYSKYTINSASLVHALMFAVDSLPGVAGLDNLGLPESGDGISDVMQEAKWESDFLAKMQDADGGFYFLVYPLNREYESNVLPDHGDAQVVWPKNTSATAAAVAALAEAASSPRFKAAYPAEAAAYLAKARLGWQFLANAIGRYGKAGSYQKITHYGDDFTHDDELAWAAAAMFVATGDPAYQQTLLNWFNPSDPATWRWGWWHGFMGWGNAERTYAFAVRSGRLAANQVDATFLAKCEAELLAAADGGADWSDNNAYGTSFPTESKHVQSAGWYFSGTQAFDLTVASQISRKPEYLDAILRNLDYEGGNNPVNVTYVTGLGWKRQREIVHQYAQNDRRVLPPNGIPLGNIQTGPVYTSTYGTELSKVVYPSDSSTSSPYPFYDRWSDTFNVTTEFVHLDQARGLASYAFLAAGFPAGSSQPWRSATGHITGVPSTILQGVPVTVGFAADGVDLTNARIVWEAQGQQPAYGSTFSFVPSLSGEQWIEAEAQLPDGRRVVATTSLFVDNGLPSVSVVATDASATIGNGSDTAVWTFTRTGNTANALTVNFNLGGTAVKWNDYRRPQGDMPQAVVIPAGASTGTITIYAVANSTGANPETVTLTVASDPAYNVGTPYNATVTIH